MSHGKDRKRILLIAVICIAGGIVLADAVKSVVSLNRYSGAVCDGATGEPMASVAVSNGRDVVLTDKKGKFSLNGWAKARFITVTVPSGYWSEEYYISVSKERKGYDFRLEPLDRDLTNHTFLQVSDSEVGKDGAGSWVDKVRETAKKSDAAFIVHTGDICYIDGLKTHIRDMNTENMGIPVRYIIGNHDYVEWGDYGEALFESIYGPVMYSFDVGKIHYICTPITHGDTKARYTSDDMARFVDNDLRCASPDKKVIIFNHDFCARDENGFVLSYGLKKTELKKHGLLAWVFGHLHYNYLNETDGVFNITTARPDCGGIDASLPAIRTVSLEGTSLASSDLYYNRRKTADAPANFVWRTALGGDMLYSDPLLYNGVIYAGTVDDGYPKNCSVTALDAKSGKILRVYKTVNSVKSNICRAGNKILIQDIQGTVYCLDFVTGKEIWKHRVKVENPENTSSSPATDGTYVYCGGQQSIHCIRLDDGSEVWEQTVSGGNSTPSGFILHENMLIVGSHWNRLLAFDKRTGKRLWENKEDGLSFIIMTPIVCDGRIFVSSGNRLYKIDAKSGKTILSRAHDGYVFDCAATPYASEGVIYFGTANKGIIAADAETLEILWTFATGIDLTYTSPYTCGDIATVDGGIVPFDGGLCFGASDGYLYVIDKSEKELHRYNIGTPVNQSPVVDGNSITVADLDGNISRIEVS